MPTKVDFDTVRKIALQLPDVEESTAWGSPAFKVHGRWMVVVPTHKSGEPDSLAFCVDFERRAELLESAPDISAGQQDDCSGGRFPDAADHAGHTDETLIDIPSLSQSDPG